MRKEIRSATTLDLEEIRTLLDKMKTEAVLDIAFVVDVNHNNIDRTDLSVGNIKGKSLKNAGQSELIDFVYKPIDANISKYPIPGEFVLVTRTGLGNYYIHTLNLYGNINNNIDERKISGYVKYVDDDNINKNVIKSSNKTTVIDKLEDTVFSLKSLYKKIGNYGDVIIEGRNGNSITLTQTENKNPAIFIENLGSVITVENQDVPFQRITANPYNEEVGVVYNISDGSKIKLISEKILLQSLKNGMFFESNNSIGFNSDKDFTVDTSRLISLDSRVITLGYEAVEPIILGNEFSKQWSTLINGIHKFCDILSTDVDNIVVNQAGKFLKQFITDGISSYDNVARQSSSKFLSKQVFVK
jgi:hypothetical protein